VVFYATSVVKKDSHYITSAMLWSINFGVKLLVRPSFITAIVGCAAGDLTSDVL